MKSAISFNYFNDLSFSLIAWAQTATAQTIFPLITATTHSTTSAPTTTKPTTSAPSTTPATTISSTTTKPTTSSVTTTLAGNYGPLN